MERRSKRQVHRGRSRGREVNERSKGVVFGSGTAETSSWVRERESRAKGRKAMIERFDHRPMLTAALALTTIVLFVVVVTLATLLITAAQPPAATSSSEGGGSNPGAVVQGNSDFYGEGWNNYGHDMDQPQPAKTGKGGDSAIDR
jgi:hypothetical protein